MHKLLPFFAIILITVLLATSFSKSTLNIFSGKNIITRIIYTLNLDNDSTKSCCDGQLVEKSSGEFDENADIAIFNNLVVDYPKTLLVYNNSLSRNQDNILGTKNTEGEEKWIEVSLSEQRLRAWEGDKIAMEFPISSGLWSPTPKGDFAIWYKTRNQRMVGGSKELGTYYNLPNVPNNMFFYKGYAIHGAYWHNNFGQPMSHGCVNSPLPNAAELFEWTGPVVPPGQNVVRATAQNPGTRVYVH